MKFLLLLKPFLQAQCCRFIVELFTVPFALTVTQDAKHSQDLILPSIYTNLHKVL